MKHFEQYIFWGLVLVLAYYGYTRIRPLATIAPGAPVPPNGGQINL